MLTVAMAESSRDLIVIRLYFWFCGRQCFSS